jgi:hypothetical protein
MGVPTTVDMGGVVPWAMYEPDPANQSTGTTSANTAFFIGTTLYSFVTVTALRFRFGTGGSGHYDIGIYDGNGNRLVSAGSTVTASGTQTYTLPTPIALSPGRYYLAFWIDNATDTITKGNANANNVVCQSASTASPLPSLMSSLTLANTATRPIVIALLQGGWS